MYVAYSLYIYTYIYVYIYVYILIYMRFICMRFDFQSFRFLFAYTSLLYAVVLILVQLGFLYPCLAWCLPCTLFILIVVHLHEFCFWRWFSALRYCDYHCHALYICGICMRFDFQSFRFLFAYSSLLYAVVLILVQLGFLYPCLAWCLASSSTLHACIYMQERKGRGGACIAFNAILKREGAWKGVTF